MDLLLKNARIIAPSQGIHNTRNDILISDGIIKKIEPYINADAKVIKLPNLCVSVGWFDSSVCFGEPGYEERETLQNGLKVASKSGFTDILLNPNIDPIPDTGIHIQALANTPNTTSTQLHPIGSLTKNGKAEDLAELFDMKQFGALAFGDYKTPVSTANFLKIALLYAQNFEGLILAFPQDLSLANNGVVNEGVSALSVGMKSIPSLAEEIQLSRDLKILEYCGGKLHIPTISTEGSVKLIEEAKTKRLDVTCSVSIHHLAISDKSIETFDTNCKVLPPLRTQRDIAALRRAVKNGVVDFVTTDHTPIDIENKRVVFDDALYGTIGLESAFGVMNHMFDTDTTIGLLSKGRERFGLLTPKIEVGKTANMTLFEPETEGEFTEKQILSSSKNSAFLGHPTKGKVYGSIFGKHYTIND